MNKVVSNTDKENAEKRAKELTDKNLKMFCPLMKDMCRLDCRFFESITVVFSRSLNKYIVEGGYCNFGH